MKKLLGLLGTAVFLIVVLIAGGMGKIIGRGVAESAFAPSKSEIVERTVQEMNKSLPIMVDNETRFERAAHGQGDTIEYHYTITTLATNAIEPLAFRNFETDLRKRVCGSSDMKKVFSASIGATYIYKATNQSEIGRVTFSPNDCTNMSSISDSPELRALETRQDKRSNVTVGSPEIGRAINQQSMEITSPTRIFAPFDTVYVSVPTDSPSPISATLSVNWSYWGDGSKQPVHAEGKQIPFNGAGRTVFQVSKPDGWPVGGYQVEILLDGNVMQSQNYAIQETAP